MFKSTATNLGTRSMGMPSRKQRSVITCLFLSSLTYFGIIIPKSTRIGIDHFGKWHNNFVTSPVSLQLQWLWVLKSNCHFGKP